MKNIILIWSLFYMSLAQAAPPTSIKGEAGSASFTQNIVLPNNQVTKQAGINSRIETGNKNLLNNASFEHATIATGWTNTGGGTPASSTTNLHDGAKSVTTTSTGAWTFYQDSTLYATAKSGTDAEASIWAYSATASADLWLCPRVNGASVTASVANGCVQYTNLGSPQKLTVFMLYGATSTGIEVKGSGAITYVLDDAYLGDRRPTVLGITTTPDTTFTGTFSAGFGTVSPSTNNCKYNRRANYMNVSCEITAGTTAASIASIDIPNSLNIDSSKIVQQNTSSNPGHQAGTWGTNSSSNNGYIVTALGTSTTKVYVAGYYSGAGIGLTAQNVSAIISTGNLVSIKFSVPILEWAGDNNAFTTKCDDPRQCETVLSANATTTSGTVANESTDFINGNCTAANPTVCTFNTGIFTVAPSCTATGSNFNNTVYQVAATSTTVTIRSFQGSTSADVASQSFNLICQKQGVDYTNSKTTQQIVQMRGVPTVSGASGAIKAFGASVTSTSGAVTNNRGGVITTCTAANPTVCTFTGLNTTPLCTTTPIANNNYLAELTTISSSGFTVSTNRTDTGAAVASVQFNIMCWGD